MSDAPPRLSTMVGNRRLSLLRAAAVGGFACGGFVVVLTWHSPASRRVVSTAAVGSRGVGSRPMLRRVRERSPEFRRRRRDITPHAAQQIQGVSHGATTGIYGPGTATLTSSASGLPVPNTLDTPAGAAE